MPRRSGAEYDHLIKVVLVGDEATGKSSLITRYCDDDFQLSYGATIGVDFKISMVEVEVDGVAYIVKMQIWDTAGQERFSSITTSFYRGADAVVVVYDVTSHDSFGHVDKWLAGCSEVNGPGEFVKVLVGAKVDLANGHREVATETAIQAAAARGMQFMETSSKTGNSVDAVFELVAEEAVRSELTRRGTLRSRVRKLRRRNRHPAGVTGGKVVSVDDGSDPTSGGCWQWLNRIPARIGAQLRAFQKPKHLPGPELALQSSRSAKDTSDNIGNRAATPLPRQGREHGVLLPNRPTAFVSHC